jgi:hypothetical protein
MFGIREVIAGALALSITILSCATAQAQSTTLNGSVNRTHTSKTIKSEVTRVQPRPKVIYKKVYVEKTDNRTYFQRHPKVKAAAVGAGVGAGAGAVTGLVTNRGVVRGAAIGAGTGAGVGLVRSSKTMKRHPIVKNTATGALVGLGLGAAGSRRGSTVTKTTAAGAAVGLGYGLFKHLK